MRPRYSAGMSIDGKTAGFALQHTDTMNRGAPSLVITVITHCRVAIS